MILKEKISLRGSINEGGKKIKKNDLFFKNLLKLNREITIYPNHDRQSDWFNIIETMVKTSLK